MNRLLVILSVFVVTIGRLCGAQTGQFNPQSHLTSAVDAKGVRHDGSSYKGSPPWLADRLSGPSPEYPMHERAMRHEGHPIVRMTLDVKTGHVIRASLLKSSGYPALDQSAVTALSRWTWRPGRWREIDMPVWFRIGQPLRGPFMPLPRS
jgi:TonB family protein